MRRRSLLKRLVGTTLASIALAGAVGMAQAQDLPDYMRPISGHTTSSPADVATQNVLVLNTAMFDLYGDAAKIFQKNILAQHPVILGLFSGAGGRFILYRPGQPPLEAPSVPVVYQLLKSVGHSAMALTEVISPYIDNPANEAWRASLLAYASQMQSALDTLDAANLPAEWRPVVNAILKNNVAFMDACAEKGAITMPDIQDFAKIQGPNLKKVVAWAA